MDEVLRKLIELIPSWRGQEMAASPLDGGLTNRNFRVHVSGESFVVRIAGANSELLGIDRAVEHACSVEAAALGIGAKVEAYLPEHNILVTRFISDRLLSINDIQRPEVLNRVVASLQRYHERAVTVGTFSPFNTVRCYFARIQQFRVSFPEQLPRALTLMAKIEAEVASDEPHCPCHNDLLAANFFDDGATVRIIDWEYGGMGDRLFDLGNLAANNEFEAAQERMLLHSYFGEVRRDHLLRLRLMRLASDLRESLWGFLQSGISTLDVDYFAYGRKHLNRFLAGCTALGIVP